MSDIILFFILMPLVGAVCLGWFIRNLAYVWKLWRHGTRTTGKVVDHERRDTSNGPEWEPIIAFRDEHGNQVTTKQIVRVDYRLPLSQTVAVVYLAHKPTVMHIDSRAYMVHSVLSHGLLLFIGVLFLFMGLGAAISKLL